MIDIGFTDRTATRLKHLVEEGMADRGRLLDALAPFEGAPAEAFRHARLADGGDSPFREVVAAGVRILGVFDDDRRPRRFIGIAALPASVPPGSWSELREIVDLLAEDERSGAARPTAARPA
jgi:hypothetical protein